MALGSWIQIHKESNNQASLTVPYLCPYEK
jgi:hypothetical protein